MAIWKKIQEKILEYNKIKEMQLLEKWNDLSLSENTLKSIQKFDELIYDMDRIGCKTSIHRKLFKFKEMFKDKYSILIQSIEANAIDSNLTHTQELKKLKDGLKLYVTRNESNYAKKTKIQNTNQHNSDRFPRRNNNQKKRNLSKTKCYVCGKMGHLSYNCWRNP